MRHERVKRTKRTMMGDADKLLGEGSLGARTLLSTMDSLGSWEVADTY